MYLKDYVKLGAKTLFWIVGVPVWVPLAIIGYLADRFSGWMIEKTYQWEKELEDESV